nr:MAG TPA: hypothetical protein [Caudoviricetes sp.]
MEHSCLSPKKGYKKLEVLHLLLSKLIEISLYVYLTPL